LKINSATEVTPIINKDNFIMKGSYASYAILPAIKAPLGLSNIEQGKNIALNVVELCLSEMHHAVSLFNNFSKKL